MEAKKKQIANNLRSEEIELRAGDPMLNISGAENELTWEDFFSNNYYKALTYELRDGTPCSLKQLCNRFYTKKIFLAAPTGYGKTSTFTNLFLNNMTRSRVYHYVPAHIFNQMSSDLTPYQKEIKKALTKKDYRIDGVILIDGFEEAFLNDFQKARTRLKGLSENPNAIWIACRPDFYEKIPDDIKRNFNKAKIRPWNEKTFWEFIKGFCDGRNDVIEKVKNIISKFSGEIKRDAVFRPMYATLMALIAKNDIDNAVYNWQDPEVYDEYVLLDRFMDAWCSNELRKRRAKDDTTEEKDWRESVHLLTDFFVDVYRQRNPLMPERDILISPFFVKATAGRRRAERIQNIYPREFLVYFIVEAMLEAALNLPREADGILKADKIIRLYFQTFYDDITDLLQKALKHQSRNELQTIYNNLFAVYRFSYESEDAAKRILQEIDPGFDEKVNLLKLRDELMYCIMRLSGININGFLEYAKEKNDRDSDERSRITLSMGLAYGMANLGRQDPPLTLVFAKKVISDPKVDAVQRAFTLNYYGDVPAVSNDAYIYEDNEKQPWDKLRRKKLNRLMKKEPRDLRFRLLDLPLLYSFYKSRDFKDCISYADYRTIERCSLPSDSYTKNEFAFISKLKTDLVNEYKDHLIRSYVGDYPGLMTSILTSGTEEAFKKNILRQIKMLETVNDDLRKYWEVRGKKDLEDFYNRKPYDTNIVVIKESELENALRECCVVIMSANQIEGETVTRCLIEKNGGNLERCIADRSWYQLANVDGVQLVHLWPRDTSSFTARGSFNSLKTLLARYPKGQQPKYVFAVGIAFGAYADDQNLGDVIISQKLLFYDAFNKRTDGNLTLNPDEVYTTGEEVESIIRNIKDKTQKPCNFNWRIGTLLTGGTVLSDSNEKLLLMDGAASCGRKTIGGEMEGIGIYFACQTPEKPIPFLVIKGICDWGVNKNGWKFAENEGIEADDIKDSVQAMGTRNAFNTMLKIMEWLGISSPAEEEF